MIKDQSIYSLLTLKTFSFDDVLILICKEKVGHSREIKG